jgi:replication factor C subunit 1
MTRFPIDPAARRLTRSPSVPKNAQPTQLTAEDPPSVSKKAKVKTPTKPKQKSTPAKRTPTKKEPPRLIPKPPGYPKPDNELKFSVLETTGAWAANDSRADPPNKGAKPAPRGPSDCLEGVTFVITGILDSLERDQAEDYVKRHGGKVTGSVSGRTSYVLVGMDCGPSKIKKAKEHGTTLIDEDGLFAMVQMLADAAPEKPERKPTPADEAPSPNASAPPPAPPPTTTSAPPPTAAGGSGGSGGSNPKPAAAAADTQPLWVNKYKPSQPAQLIGNGKNIADLRKFLSTWNEIHVAGTHPLADAKGKDKPMKAVLISGPPGIGKSSAATIIAKQLGFEVTEVNASDTRGKSSSDVKDGVGGKASNAIREMVTNRAMSFFGGAPKKMCLIMDEVDGMSGGDRGGVQELITCIKLSKIPIICICNDKYNQKLKSLQNYTQDMPFSRPTKPQILNRMLKIAADEGISMSAAAMEALIETTNNDIRLIINQLQMRRLTKQSFEYDDIKGLSKKDVDMGPFTAVDKLCAPNADRMSVNDRLNLVFQDSDIIPLFIQENYVHYRPYAAKDELHRLQLVAKASACISEGDVMNKSVRAKQNWGLMPYANVISSVMPTSVLRGNREVFGSFPGERNFNRFPGWLGKNSTHGKNKRLLTELRSHCAAGGAFKGDLESLRGEYVPLLKSLITRPLKTNQAGGKEKEGIPEVMAVMDAYSLTRLDWEAVQDVSKFKGTGALFADPAAGIPTAVKSAFTRECNSGSRVVHSGILVQEAKKGRKRGGGADDDGDDDGDDDAEEADGDGPAKPKLSAKKLAAMGFVAKDDGKKKPAAKGKGKKPAAKKK